MNKDMQLALSLRFNGGNVSSGLNNMQRQLNRTSQAGMRGFSRMRQQVSMLSREINGFSTASRLVASAGLAISMRSAVAGVVDLEKAMLKAKSNLMSGAKDAADLNRQLMAVRQTAKDIRLNSTLSDAEGVLLQNELMKAGVKQELVFGKKGVGMATAALAQIGGMSPEVAAEAVGKVVNQFSLKSSDEIVSYIDSLVRSADASATNPMSILYNIEQAGSTAADLGVDPNKLNAVFGYLDPLGNQAGTAMNRFLKGLAGTTPAQRKAIQASGLEFWQKNQDGTTTLKDIDEVFRLVSDKFKSMPDGRERARLSQTLFGEEGARVAATASSREKSFIEFEQSVKSASGTADKLKTEMEGLGASFTRLNNTIFSNFDESFAPVRKGMTKGVNLVQDGIENGYGTEMLVGGAGAVIAAGMAYKRMTGGKGMMGKMGDLLSGGRGGMQRVFVVNWPARMLSPTEQYRQQGQAHMDGPAGEQRNTKTKAKPRRMARFRGGIGTGLKVGAPVALGFGAYEAWEAFMNDEMSAKEKNTAYKQAAGGTAGSLVGGILGGAAGALFGGAGAVPGALIGSQIGDVVGRKISEYLSAQDEKPIHIENKIETHVDGEVVAEKFEKRMIGHARRHD